MAEHHYKFNVTMTCGGCSGAVERVLKKLDGTSVRHTPSSSPNILFLSQYLTNTASAGVKSYNVSLDTQTADITAEESLDYTTVLEKIKKTGKTVNSGEADGVVQAI
jgi:copper chaperone